MCRIVRRLSIEGAIIGVITISVIVIVAPCRIDRAVLTGYRTKSSARYAFESAVDSCLAYCPEWQTAGKALVVWLNRGHILDYGETHRSCFWKRS